MAEKLKIRYGYGRVLFYVALFLGMLCMNFTMKNFEPFSLALLCAALLCGANPVAAAGTYILAGGLAFTAGGSRFLAAALAGCLLGGIFLFYGRTRRTMRAEIALYLLAALAPFVWIFGTLVYGSLLRALLVAAAIFLLCFVFAGAMRCVLFRLGRRKLSPEDPMLCAAAVAAAGIGLYNLAGAYAYESIALLCLLFCCSLLRNGNAALCALALSLPASVCRSVAAAAPVLEPCGLFALYAAIVLDFVRAGKLPAALALFFSDVTARYFTDFFSPDNMTAPFAASAFYLAMLVPLIPCLLFAMVPESLLSRLAARARQYNERRLTRASINRNRALVGEKLFEISAAFREIEAAFETLGSDAQADTDARAFLLSKLQSEVCAGCEKRGECGEDAAEALAKLAAIGCAKGKVNLIDLPAALSSHCTNPSSLLFSLNKLLAEYRRGSIEAENAAQGRKLLAEHAHGLAEMLKNLAIEQSAPLGAYAETERRLKDALGRAGVACDEVLVSGEPAEIYITAAHATGEKLCRIAERVFNFPLTVSAKRALSPDRHCWLLRRRPHFDAAFGVSSATKEGESACGDTSSLSRIDERTFLCALSDGMGSGEYARRISDCSLSLIESFYRAGLSGEIVLSTVNRLLSFNREESFACIDMATVNLDTGRADIIKIGSPLGFLLADDSIEILESNSLPLGVLEGVRPTALQRSLSDGNVLLLISDGITAAFGSSTDIADFLARARTDNPQTLADGLLAAALSKTGGIAIDDMTAVAVRLILQ